MIFNGDRVINRHRQKTFGALSRPCPPNPAPQEAPAPPRAGGQGTEPCSELDGQKGGAAPTASERGDCSQPRLRGGKLLIVPGGSTKQLTKLVRIPGVGLLSVSEKAIF